MREELPLGSEYNRAAENGVAPSAADSLSERVARAAEKMNNKNNMASFEQQSRKEDEEKRVEGKPLQFQREIVEESLREQASEKDASSIEELNQVRQEIEEIEKNVVGTPKFGAEGYGERLAELKEQERRLQQESETSSEGGEGQIVGGDKGSSVGDGEHERLLRVLNRELKPISDESRKGQEDGILGTREKFAEADRRLKEGWDIASEEDIHARDEDLDIRRAELQNALGEFEKSLNEDYSLTPDIRKERLEKFVREKFFEEFKEVYDAKTDMMVKERQETRTGKVVESVRRLGGWYRKLPLRYKLGVSGLLAAGSIGIGLSGFGLAAGTTYGIIAAGFLGGGHLTQRSLAAGATFISLEGFIAKRQQKKFSKEFERRHNDTFKQSVAEYEDNNVNGYLRFLETSDMLTEAHFELENGLRRMERWQTTRRLIYATSLTGALQLIPMAMRLADSFGIEWPAGKEEEVLKSVEAIEEKSATEKLLPSAEHYQEEDAITGVPAGMTTSAEAVLQHGGMLSETEWKGATSVWNLAEKELAARGMLDGLNEAQKTYLVDAIKDKVVENPQVFGLENADQFNPGKFDYDKFSALFGDKTEIDDILSGAKGLTLEQMESITRNNETLHQFFHEYPDAPRTSDNYDAILKGKGITGEVQAPIDEQAPIAEVESPVPAPEDAVGNIQNTKEFSTYAETFAGLREELNDVFGDKAEEATTSLNNYMTLHPNVSLEKLTAFVGEMDDIDNDAMKLIFGEGGDSVENRLALLRNLLMDERLDINKFGIEQINGFEDLIEDEDWFRGIIGEHFGKNPMETKLRILKNYLFEQQSPLVTDENREEILMKIIQSEDEK